MPIKDCQLACIYHFWIGRNAWHSTWANHYPEDDAFSLDLDELVSKIETSRTKGSTFSIQEIPAIAIITEKSTLVISDLYSRRPFHSQLLGTTRPELHTLQHVGARNLVGKLQHGLSRRRQSPLNRRLDCLSHLHSAARIY